MVVAVSCGGAGGTVDVPVQGGRADAGVSGVRAPSTATGGTLRLVAGQVDSLDPQRSYLPGVWNLMRLYTRTLVTYSARSPAPPATSSPTSPPTSAPARTAGRPGPSTCGRGSTSPPAGAVTSKDVKYGIERSFASEVVVGGPTYVVDLLDDPADPYAGPYQDGSADKLGLKTIATPDDRTIIFTLRRADPDFPYVLALPSSSPVPPRGRHRAPATRRRRCPPGPYVVTTNDPQTGIVLERNPHWSRATDPVRTALPDRVVVRAGLSGLDRDQALLAGSADIDVSGTGVQALTTPRLTGDAVAGRVDDVTTGSVRLLALPTTVAPMDNPACRAAVAQAVDRQALQDALGRDDDAVVSTQLWPRELAGGPPAGAGGPDPAAARRSLTACGKPDGFSTVLAVSDTPSAVQLARAVAGQLKAVGIRADVRPLDATSFYATDIGKPDAVTKAGYGIVLAT